MRKIRARYLFIGLITIYQKVLSPSGGFIPKILGRQRETCVFYPTCSEYSKEAFLAYGTFNGLNLTIRRILRCRPFKEMSLDSVPEDVKKLSFRKKVR